MVNVGKIVSVGDKVVVKPVYKPGEAPFEDYDGYEQMEASYDEETYDLSVDILVGDWRIIKQ